MDFALTIADGQVGAMTFDPADSILNNIFLSLEVRQGSWWAAPDFGLRQRGRMKNTEAKVNLIRHDYQEALQWLLDSGRAKSIEVFVESDSQDLYRLKILVEAVQADGRKVTFETFTEVV